MSDAPLKPGSGAEERLAVARQHHQAGRLADAAAELRELVRADPQHAEGLHLFGLVQLAAGRLGEAVELLQRSVRCGRQQARRWSNLGVALRDAGRLEEALAACDRAIVLDAAHAGAHNNRGTVLLRLRQIDAAVASFRTALALLPGLAAARVNLGAALRAEGRTGEALTEQRAASRTLPDDPDAHCQLGVTLRAAGDLDGAVTALAQAVKIAPGHGEAWMNLGNALAAQGRVERALRCQQNALRVDAGNACAHSNLLLCRQYAADADPLALRRAHEEWDLRHGSAWWSAPAPPRDPAPERRLRVGFVSPDFARHPVGYLLIRTFEALDRAAFELRCYSDVERRDALSARFAAASDAFVDVCGDSADTLAERIRADRVDVLIDLAGHTGGNRLPVFARRPAPVQLTWIGYPGTSGLRAMDGLIACAHHLPPGTEDHCTEALLRTQGPHLTFEPPADVAEVGAPPGVARGHVTFGCFNNPAKLNRRVIECWAEILRRVPGSVLLFKYTDLDRCRGGRALRDAFVTHGVAGERILLRGASPIADWMRCHAEVDFMLDPFPFGGGMTSLLSLWMGVPIVTRAGRTIAGRQTSAFLYHLGLGDTLAADERDYAELAVAWATDRERLILLRAGLRERFAASPLADGAAVAGEVGGQIRRAWRAAVGGAAL